MENKEIVKPVLVGICEFCKDKGVPVMQNDDGTLTIGIPAQKEKKQ